MPLELIVLINQFPFHGIFVVASYEFCYFFSAKRISKRLNSFFQYAYIIFFSFKIEQPNNPRV